MTIKTDKTKDIIRYRCDIDGHECELFVIQQKKEAGRYCYCAKCRKSYDRANNMKVIGKYDGSRIVPC